jgi:integrase
MEVSEFFESWGDVPRGRSADTIAHNRLMVKPFVRRFGGRSLGDIGRGDAAAYMAEFPGHARYARTLMEDAREGHLIDRNPFEGLRLPSRARPEARALTEAEVWELVDCAGELYPGLFGVRFRAMIATSAFSGVRLSAAAALMEEDVLDAGDAVELSVVEKGAQARRYVLGHSRARGLLSEALAVADGGLVFRSKTGRWLSRSGVCRAFAPVKRETGLDGITFHHLRHFCASWLIDNGAQPIDVAIQLHDSTDPGTVLRYYVHASRKASRERMAQVCA